MLLKTTMSNIVWLGIVQLATVQPRSMRLESGAVKRTRD
jgi:hypothetical protein